MSEEKKKRYYYYAGKEKKAGEVKKAEGEVVPYASDIQDNFDKMMERFQREFEDFWAMPPMWRHHRGWRHHFPMMSFREMMPSVDLEDKGKEFCLTVDLPGFSKDDVEIEVTDDAVAISAEKTQTEEEKKKNYVRRERSAQTFYRRVQLPEEVKCDEAKASLNDGVLEITLPKKEPKETKKLKID